LSANAWYATCSPSTESQGVERRSVGCQTVNKIFFSDQPWAWSVVGFVGMCFACILVCVESILKKSWLSVLFLPPIMFLKGAKGGYAKQGIYDLLQRKGEPGGCLMILEDNGLLEIPGLAKIPVENEAETLKLYFEGEKLRSYSNHTLNQVGTLSEMRLLSLVAFGTE
jgi:hypothetical protein